MNIDVAIMMIPADFHRYSNFDIIDYQHETDGGKY